MHLILKIFGLFIFLTDFSEATFFEYSKKTLQDLFKSLKEKKEEKKRITNIHHFHMYYYPTPVQFLDIESIETPYGTHYNELHSDTLKSAAWVGQEYRIPVPRNNYPSNMINSVNDYPSKKSRKMWSLNGDVIGSNPVLSEIIHHSAPLIPVPFQQQIIIQQSPREKEKEPGFLASFFRQLRRIKSALLHGEESRDNFEVEEQEPTAVFTTIPDSYVYSVHQFKSQSIALDSDDQSSGAHHYL